jgi:2-C-methyl-D-erythritol 4-phosphate cytidylyltransferase
MAIALIVAAGSGQRLGANRPKALVELAGRPMLQWSLDALAQVDGLAQIVVAMPPGISAPDGVEGVDGGSSRSDSVRRALAVARIGESDERGHC